MLGLGVGKGFDPQDCVIPQAATEPIDEGRHLPGGVRLDVGIGVKPVVLDFAQMPELNDDPSDGDDASGPRASFELKVHELGEMPFVP